MLLDVSHLGAEFVKRNFRGMVLRCRDVGYDLTREPVVVSPTAHFLMGGVHIDAQCRSGLDGLFVAGEDAAGVHGANRLGGNGVAESTVFGGLAGDLIADWLADAPNLPYHPPQVDAFIAKCMAPFRRVDSDSVKGSASNSVYPLRERLRELMWNHAGLVRDAAGLEVARAGLAELREQWSRVGCGGGLTYNLAWMDYLNLENHLDVCDAIVACALARTESRGSHYRSDFPQPDAAGVHNLLLTLDGGAPRRRAVRFPRLRPGQAA